MARRLVRAAEPVIVRDPEIPGNLITLDPKDARDADDALVKAYPWAFIGDDELAIETATARPGEKRSVRRPE